MSNEMVRIEVIIEKERAETFMGLLVGEGTSFEVTPLKGVKRKAPSPKKGKGKHGGLTIRDVILTKMESLHPSPVSDLELMTAVGQANCSPMSVSSQTSALAKENIIKREGEGKWVLCKK